MLSVNCDSHRALALADHERLRDGPLSSVTAESIAGLAPALIRARIMRKWMQKDLADRLAVADARKLRAREVITFEPL